MNYCLPNTLNIANAVSCLDEIQALKVSGDLTIDASQVEKIDAAGMALLLELITLPQTKIINPSTSIVKVAELYQLNLAQ